MKIEEEQELEPKNNFIGIISSSNQCPSIRTTYKIDNKVWSNCHPNSRYKYIKNLSDGSCSKL